MTPAVADTSFIIGVIVSTDAHHARCVQAYKLHNPIYVPQTTLAETAYLITREVDNKATALFLEYLAKSHFEVTALTQDDIKRTAELLLQYADSRVDFVDATVIAVAERLSMKRVLTLDQRDFALVRPKHIPYFEIQP
jgi:uncharacterized protein